MERQRGSENKQTALYEVPSLAIAAHELKAPLALMRQLSLLLRDESPEVSVGSVEVQRALERLTLTSERSLRLVEMLTRHARLDEGLFLLEPVHAGRVCEEVAHELTPLCKALNRQLQVRMPARSTLVVANRELLHSIALGLCDNALTHTESPEPVTMSIAHKNSVVRLSVRDHGPRMPADTFKRLESRLGNTTQPISHRPNSSGLGLYIAGQFATAMHSKLGVIRHRTEGATFYVDTPLSSQMSLLTL